MRTPEGDKKPAVAGPNFPVLRFIYDFELCADYEELKAVMENINYHGYDLVSVTQDARGFYTVFFRRPSYA